MAIRIITLPYFFKKRHFKGKSILTFSWLHSENSYLKKYINIIRLMTVSWCSFHSIFFKNLYYQITPLNSDFSLRNRKRAFDLIISKIIH